MKKPKVSVIVPVYNAAKYLEKCIDSITNQTLKEIEIILINDGSQDSSLEICLQKAKDDKRIKVIDKMNEGQGIARNIGIKQASGEYLAFVDSDDYIDKETYEEMYNRCKNDKSDYCITPFSSDDISFFDGKSTFEGHEIKKYILIDLLGNYPQFADGPIIGASVCTKLFSANVIKNNKIEFVSERVYSSEDGIFNINYVVNSKKVSFYNKKFYHYRSVDESFTHKYRKDYLNKINEMYKYIKINIFNDKMNENERQCLNNCIVCQYINCITQEVMRKDININDKIRNIKKICNNDYVIEIMKECNIKLYSLKKKLFFAALKKKKLFKLYLYVKIRNIKNKKE